MAFTISYFLHLPARYPGLGEIRFDFILMGATFLAIILEGMRVLKLGENVKTSRLFLVLVAYIIITIPFVEWPGSVIRHGVENYSKTAFFYVFTVAIIDSEKRLKAFMAVFLICQLIRVAEPAYLHFTDGYWGDIAYSHTDGGLESLLRLAGAPHDVVNPNQLAWLIVGIIPFLYYILWMKGGLVNKLLFIAPLPVLVYALVLTGSRSGILSLMVVIIATMAIGRNRLRRIALWTVIALPIAMFTMSQITPELKERYMSLIDEEAVGRDTVVGRVEEIRKTIKTVANKPIVGHGLGTSREVSANFLSGRAKIAHDLYVEILQEIGVAGLVIFALFVTAVFKALAEARKISGGHGTGQTFVQRLAAATQVWVIMDLFYSLSCFGLSSWEWYLFGGIATVCVTLARERANDAEAVQVPLIRHAAITAPGGKPA